MAFEEVRRIIREEDPPRPSTRLSTLEGETLSAVSAKRQTEPRSLSTPVRGDLDWIVMKALDKDRTRRYDTASALALDVRRFLNEEPVEARPPSGWYRFRKFARRNRVALTTAALVAAALVLGTVVSTWQAVRATKAESAAIVAQQEAETDHDRAVAAEKQAKVEAQKARAAESEAKKERDQARDALVAMFQLGKEFQRAGQDEQALKVYLKTLEACKRAGKWSVGPSLVFVGAFDFKKRGKYPEAEQLFERMVHLYEEWGSPAQAAAYRQELETVRKLKKKAP